MSANEQARATGRAVDEKGTSQDEGRELLIQLRDKGFEGSDEKLSIALGRPVEEIQGWLNRSEPVDDDVVMKARGIAKERNIPIE